MTLLAQPENEFELRGITLSSSVPGYFIKLLHKLRQEDLK